MEKVEVRHQLDLVVRLLDTTTGKSIIERSVVIKKEDRVVPFLYKGNGTYILIDSGRKDATYTIYVQGYETETITVEYGESEKKFQTKEVALLPQETSYSYTQLLTMSGHLEGMEEISAIRLSTFDRTLKDFDRKKGIINYYGGTDLSEEQYALFHRETKDYEVFQIRKVINSTSALIRRPLVMPYAVKDPIVRIVKGKVSPEGDYLIRVRDDGQRCVYLVRYIVNGETQFKRVDFSKEEERSLG